MFSSRLLSSVPVPQYVLPKPLKKAVTTPILFSNQEHALSSHPKNLLAHSDLFTLMQRPQHQKIYFKAPNESPKESFPKSPLGRRSSSVNSQDGHRAIQLKESEGSPSERLKSLSISAAAPAGVEDSKAILGDQFLASELQATELKVEKLIDNQTKFFEVVLSKDFKSALFQVQELYKQSLVNIHARDLEGINALELVCSNGNADLVSFLLRHGANVNERRPLLLGVSGGNWKPLHFAVDYRQAAVIPLLLTAGEKLRFEDPILKNILHGLYDTQNEEDTQRFLKQVPIIKDTMLRHMFYDHALKDRDDEKIQFLLAEGVNIKGKDHEGKTFLHHAASENKTVVVEHLSHLGADIDAIDHEGRTALYYAAYQGHSDMVNFLLKHNPNLYLKGKSSSHSKPETPAEAARRKGHADVAKKLESLQKNLDDQLGKAAMECQLPTLIRLVFRNKVDVNQGDKDGNTVLHHIVQLPQTYSMLLMEELLLKLGADPRQSNKENKNPIELAVKANNLLTAQRLTNAEFKEGPVDINTLQQYLAQRVPELREHYNGQLQQAQAQFQQAKKKEQHIQALLDQLQEVDTRMNQPTGIFSDQTTPLNHETLSRLGTPPHNP